MGGTGQKCLAVAESRADVAIMNFKSSSWDTCAPEALVRAGGGELTDLFGERIVYRPCPLEDDAAGYLNACGVIASSAAFAGRHRAVCTAMRSNEAALRLLTPWGLPRGDRAQEAQVSAALSRRRKRLWEGLSLSRSG